MSRRLSRLEVRSENACPECNGTIWYSWAYQDKSTYKYVEESNNEYRLTRVEDYDHVEIMRGDDVYSVTPVIDTPIEDSSHNLPALDECKGCGITIMRMVG